MSDVPSVLVWIDLETSGLEPEARILEVAVTFTDINLFNLGGISEVVLQDLSWFSESNVHPKVFEMHHKNGLIEDIKQETEELLSSLIGEPYKILIEDGYPESLYLDSLSSIQRAIIADIELIRKDYPDGVNFIAAGNSVHKDKEWIAHSMPILFSKLHYRIVDVSLYKVMFPEYFEDVEKSNHRASLDVDFSIRCQALFNTLVLNSTSDIQL